MAPLHPLQTAEVNPTHRVRDKFSGFLLVAIISSGCSGSNTNTPDAADSDAYVDAHSSLDGSDQGGAADDAERLDGFEGVMDASHDAVMLDAPDTRSSDDASVDVPPPIACEGLTLDGSFTINNSLDVETLTKYARVTGDVSIAGAGISKITLPSLCYVGGTFEVSQAGVVSLDLPSLAFAGNLKLASSSLTTANLNSLTEVGEVFYFFSPSSALSLPQLRSVGKLLDTTAFSVHAPKLAKADNIEVRCIGDCGHAAFDSLNATDYLIIRNASFSAPRPLEVVHLEANGGATRVMLPALVTIKGHFEYATDVDLNGLPALEQIGGYVVLWTKGSGSFPSLSTIQGQLDLHAPSGPVEFAKLASVGGLFVTGTGSFPSLSAIHGELHLVTSSAAVFPKLTVITRGLRIDGKGGPRTPTSFPVLTSIAAGAIKLSGPFLAPSLVTAAGTLTIEGASALDLSSLRTVGPGTPATPCGANDAGIQATTISSIDLPALESACIVFGAAYGCGS